MTLPDFLVIGAPKAGTTALHAALAQHPGLYMSAVKEPKFFLSDGPPPARGGPGDVQTYREHIWRRADYEALFDPAPPGALCGESTPLYLHDLDAHQRIRDLVPDVKLIAVLRDPVERAHSNWTHLWSAGLEPIGDFVRACEQEPQRAEAGWASFWHYTGLGKYGGQLEHLYRVFPRDQVLILRYLSLVDDPAQTLDRICAFLGVEPGRIGSVPRQNVTAHPAATLRYRTLARTLRIAAATGRFLPGRAAASVTNSLEHQLQRSAPPRQPLTWGERELVLPKFEADIRLLEQVTGDDFSFWLRPRERSGGMVGSRPDGQRQARNGQPRAA
ncbi:MAG TPA: sulfotransferase [Streptosporangiaceae bacterium]|jgi:hypothetical protein|nr:sulfotransferase [Streptosporangiaceae bacterium]